MEGRELIEAIRRSRLTGRGGAGFSTAQKWECVANAVAERKYVVANAAEGEPSSRKDWHILTHYPQDVIEGISLALRTLGADEAYLFLREDYYKKLAVKLRKLTKGLPIHIISSPGGYRCGEETVLLNAIEGKRTGPRAKPPYPTVSGLWGYPTLINNVETLRAAALVHRGQYDGKRFYTVCGHVTNPGIYELAENLSIKEVLHLTNNTPHAATFAQIGGGAAGRVVHSADYGEIVNGAGVVIIHRMRDVHELMLEWSAFFRKESCGHCVPCREGTAQLYRLLRSSSPNWQDIVSILDTLGQSSFCPLGKSASVPFCALLASRLRPLIHQKERAR